MSSRYLACDSSAKSLVLFSSYGSQPLAEEIAKSITSSSDEDHEISLSPSTSQPFPDGESSCQLKADVRGKDVFIIASTCRLFNSPISGREFTGVNDCVMELLVHADAAARASAARITAVIPYFGYARQDRKAEGRTPITARLVATLLEASGIDRVLTMDLHADQIQGFFSPKCILDHLNAGALFAGYFSKLKLQDVVVLSPDIGNMKKADKYRMGMPAHFNPAVIYKKRKNGKVESKQLMGDVSGKTVIMLDDIISTAGTMRSAIDLAADRGAKEFYIGATHGLFVGKAVENLQHPLVREIVVTDTVPQLPEVEKALPIKTLSVANLFGEAILRIHRQQSISALLGKYG